MSNYLITGAAGFIGSRLAETLLSEGHSVYGIDNVCDTYNPEFKWRRLGRLRSFVRFRFAHVDIEDGRALANAVNGDTYDAVIHLAARAGVRTSVENPDAYVRTNILGTLNVLELCRGLRVRKLVAASSSSVYGANNPMPYTEGADTSFPLSPYAASKKALEELCFTYHYLHGLDISALRFFTVYGPSGRPDMSMFRFVRAIVEGRSLTVFGDGNQMRDFSYVDDIVSGIRGALLPLGYRVFNLGASQPVKLNLVIETIERLAQRPAVIERKPADPSDVPATWADVSRAQSELNWQPRTSLEQGVGRTLDWYCENREWASRI